MYRQIMCLPFSLALHYQILRFIHVSPLYFCSPALPNFPTDLFIANFIAFFRGNKKAFFERNLQALNIFFKMLEEGQKYDIYKQV
jgi:hypothetical protein